MDKEWITLIGAILTVIGTLSGVVVGSVITYRLRKIELQNQNKREDQKALLEKLYEFHEVVCQFILDCNEFSSNIIKTADAKPIFFSKNKTIESFASSHEILMRRFAKMMSMQRVYALEAQEDWDKLMDANQLLFIAAKKYVSGEEKDYTPLHSEMVKSQLICKNILRIVERKIQSQVEIDFRQENNSQQIEDKSKIEIAE